MRPIPVAMILMVVLAAGCQHVTLDLGHGQKMTLVRIKPGTFLMGSPADEPLREDCETQHRVRITRAFYLGTTEVTQGQYAAFLADSQGKAFTPGPDDNLPMHSVSWNEAVAFCQWLSRKTGRSCRLPTEAEWEYACRAGTATMYIWGPSADGGKGYANVADEKGKKNFAAFGTFNWSDGYLVTAPVAQFKPNAWGLYDMTGNVWEFCADAYAPFSADEAVDPRIEGGAKSKRVRRGGSFYGGPRECRVAARESDPPDFRFNDIGFRVAMDPVKQ